MKKKIKIYALCIIVFVMAAVIIGILTEKKKNDAEALLYPVQVDGKWGYVDQKGTIEIKPAYAWADDFHDGIAVVEMSSDGSQDAKVDDVKYGAIDITGKMVVKPDFSYITKYNEDVAGAIKIDQDTYDLTYFILDKKGKILYTLPADMQIVSMLFNGTGTPTQSEGAILVQDDKTEMYGYINRFGKVIIPYQYYEANIFSNGLALIKNAKRQYEYIDQTGKVMIDASKYSSGSNFSEGLAAVAVQDKATSVAKYGYIDTKGNMKIEPTFAKAYGFSEGLAKVCVGDSINEYSIGYIDESGTYKVAPNLSDHYDETLFSEGLAPIADGAGGYVNKDGQLMVNPVIPKDEDNYIKHDMAGEFRNGIAKVSFTDGRIGYIDKTGKYIWDPRN